MKKKLGFTLIELIMVMVIISILAAVAFPKFINLKADAHAVTLQGVVGAINSASSINYGEKITSGTGITTIGQTCSQAVNAILQAGVPTDFTLGNTPANLVSGDNTCTIQQTSTGLTSTVLILGI